MRGRRSPPDFSVDVFSRVRPSTSPAAAAGACFLSAVGEGSTTNRRALRMRSPRPFGLPTRCRQALSLACDEASGQQVRRAKDAASFRGQPYRKIFHRWALITCGPEVAAETVRPMMHHR